jgi:hypothetical protein
MIKTILITLLLLISLPAFSGTGSGLVTRIFAHEKDNGNGVIMFATENHTIDASDNNGTPCSSHEWAFDAHTHLGKAMYSLLLAAAAQKIPVIVNGMGSCSAWGDREEPSYIYVNY